MRAFFMHGCWQRKEHFEIIREYCKTGLLVMFNVTERRNFTACFCCLLCSFCSRSSMLKPTPLSPYIALFVCVNALHFELVHCKVAELRYRLQTFTSSRAVTVQCDGGGTVEQCDPLSDLLQLPCR